MMDADGGMKMKKTLVLWTVALNVDGWRREILLQTLAGILAPCDKFEPAPGHGALIRDYGLYEYQVTEPWCERSAGEVALDCLVKGHQLGVGWRFRWPLPLAEPRESWWSEKEFNQSRLPESMAGFAGGFDDDGFVGHTRLKGLFSASFQVEIATGTEKNPAALVTDPP